MNSKLKLGALMFTLSFVLTIGAGSVSARQIQGVSLNAVTTVSVVFSWVDINWLGSGDAFDGKGTDAFDGKGTDASTAGNGDDCPKWLCGQCRPWEPKCDDPESGN